MENLKEREKKILLYMKEEIKQKGYPPTVREMCNSLGIRSTSTAHTDLANLEKKGFIRRDPSKPRAIEILDFESENRLDQRNSHYEAEEETPAYADAEPIPVVGRIAAGTPILAEENIEDSFPVPSRYLSGGVHFMLTVRGDSMVDAGILDGDYILVKQQNTARNGEIVVAMVDGFESEATVKTFYHEGDHIRLQPENPSMSPILVRDVKILGLVKGVFRYFS
ncbi:MAG: transcriptional repressor LexA [Bacillota bacterium]|nr:transcriptional repressor LexA [Bacillota bacterium]